MHRSWRRRAPSERTLQCTAAMASLRWRVLLVAVLSEPAFAYHSGASVFARGVSHRQPLLSRTSLPLRACAERERLPAAVLPITLTVFAQMIGEGLALTSLPLHMKTLGASTVLSGVAVSGFSLSSLVFTPVANPNPNPKPKLKPNPSPSPNPNATLTLTLTLTLARWSCASPAGRAGTRCCASACSAVRSPSYSSSALPPPAASLSAAWSAASSR